LAIFMKVPFTSGSVTSAGYQSWIELDSLDLETDRSLSAEVATLNHRKHGVTRFSPLTVTKTIDESSPALIGEAWYGKTGHDIEIVVAEQGKVPKEYVRYKLSKAMLQSYSVGSNGEQPHETFSFTFAHIEIKFTPHDDANRPDTPDRVAYDLSLNEQA
jgi:type VI secretion system secreted protein Hcp